MSYTTLISADALAKHIQAPSWVILDCRHDLMQPDFGRNAYQASHIPGAQFVCIDKDLSDKRSGPDGEFLGRHPLPDANAFLDTLRNLGVNHGSQVVAYDAHGGMFAARLWWMLRWVGHSAVAVLDGGLQAWQADTTRPMSNEVPVRSRGNIGPHTPLNKTVSVDTIVAHLSARQLTVVDARAPDRFRGENETIDPVGGHIPGARNRFFKDNLQADGRFKSAEALQREWQAIADAPNEIVMQCGSGVTACHNLLALEIAGMSGAALYPGSWSQWCADPSRPIATGNE